MADFDNPKNTNAAYSIMGYIREAVSSAAKMFDGTSDTNVPTGAKKINGTTKVVSQYNGSSWDDIGSVVGPTETETLTNKTLGAGTMLNVDDASVTNVELDNFKAGVVRTTVRASGSASDSSVATEKGVALAVEAVSSAVATTYKIYLEDRQTDTAKATWVSELIGTRIDVTDPAYSASNFSFAFDALIKPPQGQAYAEYTFRIRGTISKLSGGEPSFVLFADNDGGISGSVSRDSDMFVGALAADTDTVSLLLDTSNFSSFASAIDIERIDGANELCFRLSITFATTLTAEDFLISMVGPKLYSGTPISSANGTLF